MKHHEFSIELPEGLVDGIKDVGDEMTRQSGRRYTMEETIALLVVQGFWAVTTKIEFEN